MANFLSNLFGGGSTGDNTSGGGTDWWGALMSGISSYSQSREARDQQERGGLISREAIQEQGQQGRLNTEFEMGLADWYRQQERQRKRDGFSNFGQFATNQYTQTAPPPALGPAPTARSFWEAQQTPPAGG